MQTLLTVAIILTVLGILAQAGLLLGMYLMSRRLTGKANVIMDESQKVITPLQTVTDNLKVASNHAAESGKVAHAQMLHVQDMVNETHETIRGHLRQYGAFTDAVAEGLRTLFKGRKAENLETIVEREKEIIIEKDRPAA
jgi:flagellar biosynthesis chaperone FliJ